MTLDKTLQKIIQRAEFDEETFWEFCNQLKEHPGIQFEYDKCGKFENARLLPIIQGLCEEIQRLTELVKEAKWNNQDVLARVNAAIENDCPDCDYQCFGCIKNVDDSESLKKKLTQGLTLSTSALEKLGEG